MRIKWSNFGLNFNLLHSKMLCAKFDWYWPSGSGVEDFFENVVNIFSIVFPLRKRCGFFMWTNLNSLIPFTQGFFVRSLVDTGLVVLEKVFKFCQFIFDISLLLGNGTRSFIWIHLIPFTQGAFCLCHVWLKLNQWFWRRRFLNIVKEFYIFYYYTPLEKGVSLHLNELESLSPKNDSCQIWLKLAQLFWRIF